MTRYLSTLRDQPQTEGTRMWELTCPGHLEEVGRARRWTRDVLSDSPRVDDAALIVTELSANALLHTDSGYSHDTFSLTLTRTQHAITVTVADSGGTETEPHVQHPRRTALHGRGLALVEMLADRMEVRRSVHGHVVTATLHGAMPGEKKPPAATATAAVRGAC